MSLIGGMGRQSAYQQNLLLNQNMLAQPSSTSVLGGGLIGIAPGASITSAAHPYVSNNPNVTATSTYSNPYLNYPSTHSKTYLNYPSTVGLMNQTINISSPSGPNARDIFFYALKGIEESVADRNPDGWHSYDDDGASLQDLREYDPKDISLLSVVSFCLANLTDPEGTVILFENNGMVVA